MTGGRRGAAGQALEPTLRREGTAESLPVCTFADADRVYQSAACLDEVVETLLEYLLNETNFRGSGRLFLP
jgi:hypothetical protein